MYELEKNCTKTAEMLIHKIDTRWLPSLSSYYDQNAPDRFQCAYIYLKTFLRERTLSGLSTLQQVASTTGYRFRRRDAEISLDVNNRDQV
jgi:hypothetical protein